MWYHYQTVAIYATARNKKWAVRVGVKSFLRNQRNCESYFSVHSGFQRTVRHSRNDTRPEQRHYDCNTFHRWDMDCRSHRLYCLNKTFKRLIFVTTIEHTSDARWDSFTSHLLITSASQSRTDNSSGHQTFRIFYWIKVAYYMTFNCTSFICIVSNCIAIFTKSLLSNAYSLQPRWLVLSMYVNILRK